MTKLADYSQEVTGDELDAALRAGGFDGVFHYLHGTPGWVIRLETLAVVADIRSHGWWQLGIDVPLNSSDADGAAMAAAARAYGFPPGSLMALDIEPERFVLDPPGWARAADAWCDGVRAGGYSPGPYGNDDTVAACGSRADWIWRAKPDQCDPAGPGLAAEYFAGRRIVQCSKGVWGGVEFDVSYSQFTIGGSRSTGGDGMGFLSRDIAGETFDEVYAAGGEAQWGSFPGGAGEWTGGNTPATNLGSPGGAKDLVEVTGAYTTHAGVQRLNLRGVRRDGGRWIKVMSVADFSVLTDWTVASAGPAQDVPTATAADEVLRAHLRDGPA